MLGTERLLMAVERRSRQFERLGGPPGRGQRPGELAPPPVGLRMIVAEAALRACQQVFTRQDFGRPLILPAQRRLQRLPADDPQGNQVFADPAALPLLARQGNSYFIWGCEPLCDQKFTEEHESLPTWIGYISLGTAHAGEKPLVPKEKGLIPRIRR